MSREEARKEKMGAGDLRMGTGGGGMWQLQLKWLRSYINTSAISASPQATATL